MSFNYTNAKRAWLAGELNMATDDIRVLLVMTDSTAGTQEDATTIGEITTLDEMDGANYARVALATKTVTANNAANRGEFDADDVQWLALGAGARNVAAVMVYKHVTNDADSIPIAYIDSGGFPFAANGGDVTITWNADGIIQIT